METKSRQTEKTTKHTQYFPRCVAPPNFHTATPTTVCRVLLFFAVSSLATSPQPSLAQTASDTCAELQIAYQLARENFFTSCSAGDTTKRCKLLLENLLRLKRLVEQYCDQSEIIE